MEADAVGEREGAVHDLRQALGGHMGLLDPDRPAMARQNPRGQRLHGQIEAGGRRIGALGDRFRLVQHSAPGLPCLHLQTLLHAGTGAVYKASARSENKTPFKGPWEAA